MEPTEDERILAQINRLQELTLALLTTAAPIIAETPTVAPSSLPATTIALPTRVQRVPAPHWSNHPHLSNPRTQALVASTEKTAHYHRSHRSPQSQSPQPQNPPEPVTDRPRKKKFTKLCSHLKNSIAVFRKKSTFQVSYPREPLENYDISSNTVGTSTNAAAK
jgi:hypothetical protein